MKQPIVASQVDRIPSVSPILIGFAWLLGCLCAVAGAEGDDRFSWASGDVTQASDALLLAVDASDLPAHGLLRSRISVPVRLLGPPDAPHGLCFPLWVPGTHAPSGPVENLGGLRIQDEHGTPVAWERDAQNPWRILPHITSDAQRLQIDLVYIANQPTVNSIGIDVESSTQHAIINWNCALLYPESLPTADIRCVVSVRLPPGWDAASALRESDRTGDVRRYGPTSLTEVVDRPLLAGAQMQHIDLRLPSDGPPVQLHVVAAHAGDILSDAGLIAGLKRLPIEADALFGGAWFDRYDMLLRLGATGIGLEHGSSALCAAPLVAFDDEHADDAWIRELMPHEFTHSWVGKHRRPIGMLCRDFQQTPVFDGLWVYEGLTEMLGRVLAVRCGLLSEQAWLDVIATDIENQSSMPGREWRTIRDTCRAGWQLRGGSQHHPELRRGQDFYIEGALFWIAVDRRIRADSAGAHSLDDFCRLALGPHGDPRPGFSEEQIISALQAIAPDDWRTMVGRWIDGLGELDREAIMGGSGCRIDHVPIDASKDREVLGISPTRFLNATGMAQRDGMITVVTPGGPASLAGLAVGDVIVVANGRPVAQDRLAVVRALVDAVPPTPATFEVFRQKHDPQRFPIVLALPARLLHTVMTRIAGEADGFAPLLAPHAAHPVADPATTPSHPAVP
jgi:predicted metalloprotease with PDZ domain